MIKTATIHFVPVPCGCVVDRDAVYVHPCGVLECSWCGATFTGDDLQSWDNVPKLVFANTKPPLRFADVLFDVISVCQCGCGNPIVRTRGTKDEPVELAVPPEYYELLRN